MIEQKASGYISKIRFNTGKSIDVLQNDIIIFVGPNNVGKSQALKDIYALAEKKFPSTIISDLDITKNNGSISKLLESEFIGTEYGNYATYSILGKPLSHFYHSDKEFTEQPYFAEYRDVFVANLDTAARLTICNPPNNISRNSARQHPIQYAAFNSEYRKWLSKNFKKAFGVAITPAIHFGSVIPLCIGELVKLDDNYTDEQERQEAYADILNTYKQVQDQGDGIKSFTGILLYLMLNYYCTYLIDEPESFLHPPQARIMGQVIGENLSPMQQAFISTHSEHIIQGILEVCPERVKIIRIDRDGNNNSFSILNNHTFREIWSDPLLKYSNIMSGLFHKKVILCESDSDCQMYSIIEGYLKEVKGIYSETLFVHCGGKHRMARIVTALRSLNINIKLIPDMDVLNDENVFKGIVQAFGVNWQDMQVDYNDLVSNIHSAKERINRINAKTSINAVIDNSNNKTLSDKELQDIKSIIRTISKWDNIKKCGVSAIPAGNASLAFERIDWQLRNVGVFIVPVGELECFIKGVGNHGPEWVRNVLECYPDLENDVYLQIKQFIESVCF